MTWYLWGEALSLVYAIVLAWRLRHNTIDEVKQIRYIEPTTMLALCLVCWWKRLAEAWDLRPYIPLEWEDGAEEVPLIWID